MNNFNCKNCNKEFLVEEVFDNCHISWPEKSWVLFKCPNCSRSEHLELRNGIIKMGALDGVPGPSFIVENQVYINGLNINCKTFLGIRVNYKKYSKLIKKQVSEQDNQYNFLERIMIKIDNLF